MPDEMKLFSVDELTAALKHVMPVSAARREALGLIGNVEGGIPQQLSDDMLDLLSLVSDSCAERVRLVLRLSESDAFARREAFRRKLSGWAPPPRP
jgi:hypothetical protein